MDGIPVAVRRWFRGTDTMLGQVRTLFLLFVLIWPCFGLWGVQAAAVPLGTAAVAATLLLTGWLWLGYRRQRFPAWSWLPEGACIVLIAGASGYGITVGVCFMWVNFRALYGGLREKAIAVATLTAIMAAGLGVFDASGGSIVSLLITAFIALVVNHVLARAAAARDRAAARERAAASAGAGLVASTTRQEAMDVTLGAALSMDAEVSAALVVTIAGPALHVVAAAGEVGAEAAGWVAERAALPEPARAALAPGGFVHLTDGAAEEASAVFRLRPYPVVVLAPLAVYGSCFGLLVLALNRRPQDDLSSSVTTLADEAALTLDQLLNRSRLSAVVDHSPDALVLASEAGIIRFANPGTEKLLGVPASSLTGRDLWSLLHPEDLEGIVAAAAGSSPPAARPCRIRTDDEAPWTSVEAVLDYVNEHDGSRSIVFNARDVSERQRLELDLRHAQKLESVGRLAAGIAHEINTPIQFVGDNARFLETAFADLNRLHEAYRELASPAADGAGHAALVATVEQIAEEIDIDFLLEEVPMALQQSLEGISRVAGIVRAMKAFGHPGSEEKTQADLGEAIANTLIVANNEIKYVADVVTDFAELPLVHCHLGDINQVVLNLVVNAAHAISAADRGRGTITVRTRRGDSQVVIEVADTGTGVSPEIADKLFDPFFTTKEVGTGTGQGLPLVRTLVVDRHGGEVDFTSEPGVGTVFTVRLPADLAQGSDMAEVSA
ncbi:ATP-binding protein [Couchioplanes caeruleus]|uniref:two-component system sensor histidine kinase NtrB n=1 Tax=Couchioplanes caeruleus TaxID=56438 RepID=UPI0020C0E88A|nr:ATP-binding protein [Couchioplanes caeruleus]UQU62562.1 ATP-binding protein [Couchioplanes caeruleus]